MDKINLGCGTRRLEGFLGVANNINSDADILHDLNTFPYPFDDNQFAEVLIDNVIEHLDNVFKVLQEVHRITKPDGKIIIRTPHYSNFASFTDLTHKHHFSSFSLDEINYYTNAHYAIQTYVRLRGFWQIFGLNYLVNGFTASRRFWERYLSYVIRATDITFTLKPLKQSPPKPQ